MELTASVSACRQLFLISLRDIFHSSLIYSLSLLKNLHRREEEMAIPQNKSEIIGTEQSSDNEAQPVTRESIKRLSLLVSQQMPTKLFCSEMVS
jgi:hypothetical protein